MKKTLLLSIIALSVLSVPFLGLAQDRTLPETADLVAVMKTIANWLFTILMAAAAISIVAAGFTFLSSGGDADKLATARNWVIYALVGVLVALLAQVLVNFVDNMITS